eukprot:138975-Chlamydomonas_euryale.AAC.4
MCEVRVRVRLTATVAVTVAVWRANELLRLQCTRHRSAAGAGLDRSAVSTHVTSHHSRHRSPLTSPVATHVT